MTAPDTHQAIDAIWRIEQAKIIASLARVTRDVGVAEEFAQDALIAALKTWPEQGIPDNPGAWLMATAKNRALDAWRRAKLIERTHEELAREMDQHEMPDLDAVLDDDIGDDLLRLIFTACHPVLSAEARVALTLRLIGGLTTDEIAARFSRRSKRSHNALCGRNARSPRRKYRSKCRAGRIAPPGSPRCSR
jgi:RNA polymerase sigma factor (sigma-70 family)